MFRFLTLFIAATVAICLLFADSSEGPTALLATASLSCIAILVFRRYADEKDFVTYIFLAALCVRLIFGIVIHVYQLRDFAGPDSVSYDIIGAQVSDYWLGRGGALTDPDLQWILSLRGPGWGMNYLMGIIYLIAGRSIFVAQSFCAVIGAATVPMVYFCAERLFNNQRVARTAAFGVAFFPAFIIWSSQLLKDGLIVFLLVLAMTMVLQIQKRFSPVGLALLIFSMFSILSLRFYIFYMVAVAVVGSFVIGTTTSFKAIAQRTVILVAVGLGLTYLGVIRTVSFDLETYGSLERVQITRTDLVQSADSGYGQEQDVSTVGGVIRTLPVGFVYLMFAPFPWEVKNLRQSLTLPEIFLWWALMPLLVYGLWYTIKNRLRACFPVLIFTLMLMISYSIFQGNVGAAYRQRTQIQVFLFMFIAVGFTLIMEKRADRKLVELNRKRALERELRTRFQQSHQV